MIPRTGSISRIGLDLGGRTIKAAQLGRTASGWRLLASCHFERTGEGELSAEMGRIAEILDRQGFRGRSVALAAPESMLQYSTMELPPRSSGAPLETIARLEVARTLGAGPDSFEMVSWDLPRPARAAESTHVIAAACVHEACEPVISAAELAGLRVEVIEPRACALARALGPLADPEAITSVIEIGAGGSMLLILHHGVVVYQRSSGEAGYGLLPRMLAAESGLPPDLSERLALWREEGPSGGGAAALLASQARRARAGFFDYLVRDVVSAARYASHRYPEAPRGAVLLLGSGATIPGCPEYLSAQIDAPVRVVRPAEVLTMTPVDLLGSDWPGMIAALGLAMHAGEEAS